MRSTYTLVELPLSPAAYDEIKAKLAEAGYHHALIEDGMLDMHGIGITQLAKPATRVCRQCKTPEGERHNYRHRAVYE